MLNRIKGLFRSSVDEEFIKSIRRNYDLQYVHFVVTEIMNRYKSGKYDKQRALKECDYQRNLCVEAFNIDKDFLILFERLKNEIMGGEKMPKVINETSMYRTTVLYESKVLGIRFIEDKRDRSYDRIKFVRYGNEYVDPESLIIFRYEDEQALEQIVNMYREKEV